MAKLETELIMGKRRKSGQDWSKQENAIKGTEKQTLVEYINLFHKREGTTHIYRVKCTKQRPQKYN